jgi:hypothetical protein
MYIGPHKKEIKSILQLISNNNNNNNNNNINIISGQMQLVSDEQYGQYRHYEVIIS